MKLLEDKILSCGRVLPGEVLKIDSFLNHQIDVELVSQLGKEFYRRFSSYNISKILTIESSGIALAFAAAQYFKVPVVFAKKGSHKNVGNDVYYADCYSYTKGETYQITVSKAYLGEGENILIIDDFLANGAAANCLINILSQAQSNLVGIGIAVEKGFQKGGKNLRERGINLQSLAIIDSMTDSSVSFRADN
ncbi:MAG: xanthine phosphoribosyltransferase [Oscillospiraceae bacterium]|nr:xanthine phosphoribosyltransferase [Oscillospiraceae bacterium]